MIRPRALLAFALLLCARVRAAPPELRFEAPPELAAEARVLARVDAESFLAAQELTGMANPGPPIRVVLEPEGTPTARETPSFITGFATREGIVLFPRRAPRYPTAALPDVLRHEVAHVLLFRASGGRPLPRWFHEGVATAASRPRGLEDGARLMLEAFRRPVALAELDRMFAGDEASVARAYTLAGSLVSDLLDTYGRSLPGAIAARVAAGSRFDDAFADVTGVPIAVEDWRFLKRQRGKERWLLVLTSSATVWTFVTVLGVAAMLKRRRRDARQRELWAAEEAAREAASGTSLAAPEAEAPMANKKKKAKAETAAVAVLEPEGGDRFPEPRNLNDPDHGTKTRHSDRPEFDDAEKDAEQGWAGEAVAVDEAETMASTGDSSNSFVEIASGTATGFGIDRGITTGTGGLAAGEDIDAVAEGDYWRENFETRPYYQAGTPYERYEPGYRLGWEAAADLQFEGREFEEVTNELEAQWFERMGEDAESWELVQPAARDAWERVRKGAPVPKRGFRKERGDTDKGNRG